jgi:hypothetical protein
MLTQASIYVVITHCTTASQALGHPCLVLLLFIINLLTNVYSYREKGLLSQQTQVSFEYATSMNHW